MNRMNVNEKLKEQKPVNSEHKDATERVWDKRRSSWRELFSFHLRKGW